MNKFRKSAGVILKYGDEVLLCKRGPKETLPNIWSIPGGGIENGESPGQAAIREFKEETDIEINVHINATNTCNLIVLMILIRMRILILIIR